MKSLISIFVLIHATIIITTGIYLLICTILLIQYSLTILILCLWVGVITTIFSFLISLFQQNIKKVIIYFTMSQLKMMVIIVDLLSYNIILFYFINHILYKRLLFLKAGTAIYFLANN